MNDMALFALPGTHQQRKEPRRGLEGYRGRRLMHDRDTFHAFMVDGAEFDHEFDMPKIEPIDWQPSAVIPFSIAMDAKWHHYDCAVHFCEADQRLEPFWSNPQRYLPKLTKFEGVLGLDYSTCIDFPRPLKEWNAYRNQASNYYLQNQGLNVAPLLRGDPDIIDREVAGIPQGSTIALSPCACVKHRDDRRRFIRGAQAIVERVQPCRILVQGTNSYGALDFLLDSDIPVHFYPPFTHRDWAAGGQHV